MPSSPHPSPFVSSTAAAADSRLLDAIKRQDKAEIAALLKQRVDVNAPQPDGTAPIHWALYHDDAATLDLLIRAGAKVNAVTDAGLTPLWVACSANTSAPTIRRLLDAGADPNRAPNTGETALMWCARGGAVEAVKALLSRGAKVDAREKSAGQTALMWAVAARHPEVVKTLLEVGADPRSRSNARPSSSTRGSATSLRRRRNPTASLKTRSAVDSRRCCLPHNRATGSRPNCSSPRAST